MSYGAVQFYGIENVVDAYTNKRIPAFAIWCGKQLQFRYDGTEGDGEETAPSMEEGAQLLRSYLEALYQGSSALYTLKTYDDLPPGAKIRPSTEYDTAFNFKLTPPGGMIEGAGPAYAPRSSLAAALEQINKRLTVIEEGEGDEEIDDPPETLQEAAIGLLDNPEKLRDVAESIRSIVETGRALFGLGVPPGMAPAVSMGAVTRTGTVEDTGPGEVDLSALESALNTLGKHDARLVDHLTKLAAIAESNPVRFKSFLAILETM